MSDAVAAKPKTRRTPASLAGGLIGLLRAPESAEEPGLAAMLAALAEPAAAVSMEGRVLQANAPWRAALSRSSKLAGGAALYTAFASARPCSTDPTRSPPAWCRPIRRSNSWHTESA